jgi:transposase
MIGCALKSIYYWKRLRQEGGDEALKPKPVPGRPEKLSGPQKEKLKLTLLQGPLKCGYSTDLWTTRRIGEVIERKLNVVYHPNHIWWLLQEMGWSCQKPERKAREQNKEEVAHWKHHVWPHIKKRQKTWYPSGLPR